jgi:hypothetical protein
MLHDFRYGTRYIFLPIVSDNGDPLRRNALTNSKGSSYLGRLVILRLRPPKLDEVWIGSP